MDAQTRRLLADLEHLLALHHATEAGRYATTPPGPYPRGEQINYEHTQAKTLDAITRIRAALAQADGVQGPDALTALLTASRNMLAFSFSAISQAQGYPAALKTFLTHKRTLRKALQAYPQAQGEE